MKARILSAIILVGLLLFTNGLIACPSPPIAILSCSQNMAFVGNAIHFDGSSSYPSSGYITQYHWDFHYDGGFNAEQTTSNSTTDYSYSTPGTYTIALVVVNSYGLSSEITSQSIVTVQVKDIIYVDKNATGNNSGLSWENAFNRLEDALNVASDGVQIWVAQGTYRPATENASFILRPNITLYGGFAGNETLVAERDWVNNKTILSGDVLNNDGQPGDPLADNSYNVVKGANGAVLDGFIIMSGVANYLNLYDKGGGMLNEGANSIVRNCVFLGNWGLYGGAIYNDSSAVEISNCIFSGNGAGRAGAIYNNSSNASIVGCTISRNGATDCGGIYNSNSKPAIISSIVYGNTGGSVINVSASEPYISFSDVQGCGGSGSWNSSFGTNGGGNIDADPLFVDADGADNVSGTLDDDVHLQTGPPASPCIGTGVGGEDMGFNWPKDATTLNNVTVFNPVDVVVSQSGNVYVLSSTTSPSQVFIYDGVLTQQGIPIDVDATNPKGIALDSSGRIYIADTGGNRILRYKNDGGWLLDAAFNDDGIVGEFGTGDGQFDQPWGIAVDWSGFVYVTDNANDRVQVFDSAGGFIRNWGQPGSGDGQLDGPSDLCMIGTSKILVADSGNNRIQNFSNYGNFLGKFGSTGSGAGQFDMPRDICYDLLYDQIIVADTENDRLQVFRLNSFGDFGAGEPEFVMEIKETGDADLSGPFGVACTSTDTTQIIYVADTGNNRVIRLEAEQDPLSRTPLHIWELFKAALWSGDIQRAVGFMIESNRDDYQAIFTEKSSLLQTMISDFAGATLELDQGDVRLYEVSNVAGTELYPVIFIRRMDGNWEIGLF